jgi:hypothetical protein
MYTASKNNTKYIVFKMMWVFFLSKAILKIKEKLLFNFLLL